MAEKKPSKNLLKLLSQVATLPNPMAPGATARDKQLALRGFLSQWYGLDENGDAKFLGGNSFKHWPGIVDDVIAMPTVLPDKWVPDASRHAADRLEKLNAKMHEDMELAPAHGFRENMIDAAGTMAGQVPTGGAKAVEEGVAKTAPSLLRRAGTAVKDLGEWFTPTVEKTPGSYLTGTLVGGASNTAAEPSEDTQGVNMVSKYGMGGTVAGEMARMKGRYAGGGKATSALSAINDAISAIESGDHSAAVSLLRPHKDNSAVAEVLKSLGEPEGEE